MRYATAKQKEYSDDMAYRYYITDALMAIAQNTELSAAKLGARGSHMSKRFADSMAPVKKKKPTKSGKDIANDLIGRIAKVQ